MKAIIPSIDIERIVDKNLNFIVKFQKNGKRRKELQVRIMMILVVVSGKVEQRKSKDKNLTIILKLKLSQKMRN